MKGAFGVCALLVLVVALVAVDREVRQAFSYSSCLPSIPNADR